MDSKIGAKTKKAKSFDIFISHNWDVKPQVLKLYKILTEKNGLRVWIGEYEMGSSRLNDGTFIQIRFFHSIEILVGFFTITRHPLSLKIEFSRSIRSTTRICS